MTTTITSASDVYKATLPPVFKDPTHMVKYMYAAQLSWGALVYTGVIKRSSDYATVKSPLMAIDLEKCDNAEAVIVDCMLDERTECFSESDDTASLQLGMELNGMRVVVQADQAEIEDLTEAEMKEAMKAAGIEMPELDDSEEFAEDVKGAVMFFFFDVVCTDLEESDDETEPPAKKQRK